jgi:hypothetical protein
MAIKCLRSDIAKYLKKKLLNSSFPETRKAACYEILKKSTEKYDLSKMNFLKCVENTIYISLGPQKILKAYMWTAHVRVPA